MESCSMHFHSHMLFSFPYAISCNSLILPFICSLLTFTSKLCEYNILKSVLSMSLGAGDVSFMPSRIQSFPGSSSFIMGCPSLVPPSSGVAWLEKKHFLQLLIVSQCPDGSPCKVCLVLLNRILFKREEEWLTSLSHLLLPGWVLRSNRSRSLSLQGWGYKMHCHSLVSIPGSETILPFYFHLLEFSFPCVFH